MGKSRIDFRKLRENWVSSKSPIWRRAVALLVVALAATGVTWGSCWALASIAMKRADSQLQKGFGALAAETLDGHRKMLVRRETGCRVLIAAYFGARRVDRLEWAGQACLESGFEIPETYIGLAAARELSGRDNEALQLLNQIAPKFPQSPDIVFRIAQILRRNKQDENAVIAYSEAARRAPNNAQLAMDALEYFSSLGKWSDARRMADSLKAVQTDNPEIKLMLARALSKGGDPAGAQALVQTARELMASKPDLKPLLEKAYPDLLGSAPPPKSR